MVGIDTTMIAASAKEAGYTVFAVDYYGDSDLKMMCKDYSSVVKQEVGKSSGKFKIQLLPELLFNLTKKFLRLHQIDGVLLASGLEDSPQILLELNDLVPIIGNKPDTIRKVRSRKTFFDELKKLKISHPHCSLARDFEEGYRVAKDIGFPVLVKPTAGSGGIGIRVANGREDLRKIFRKVPSSSLSASALIQEYMNGTNASIALLASKEENSILTINEQILGMQLEGSQEPFTYCGNIVPATVHGRTEERCQEIAQRIAASFGLLGSNGVDVIISEAGEPFVLEVNPRFQGTLECVERSFSINLVKAHMKACVEEAIPSFKRNSTPNVHVRLILYALQRSMVPDISNLKETRNIPLPGSIIEKGEPICSVIVERESRKSALIEAGKMARQIYQMMKQDLSMVNEKQTNARIKFPFSEFH